MKLWMQLIVLFFVVNQLFGQDTLVKSDSTHFHISGYFDAYLGFHSAENAANQTPLMVSSNCTNQPTINVAMVELKTQYEHFRSIVALGLGSYFQNNYANEKPIFRNVLAANCGIKPFKKKEIWIDAGVLSSPYTNETAISIDHLLYSRALAGEYVPYYLTGINLTVPLNKKWTANIAYYNGWQHITDNNQSPALGFQLTFQPSNKHFFSLDGFRGNENSSTQPNLGTRTFLDCYWIYNLTGKWSVTSCVYAGKQNNYAFKLTPNSFWFQANANIRYTSVSNWRFAGRIEFFNDEHQVMLPPNTNGQTPLKVMSETISIGKLVAKQFLFRAECRHFLSKTPYFLSGNTALKTAFWVTFSCAFRIN